MEYKQLANVTPLTWRLAVQIDSFWRQVKQGLGIDAVHPSVKQLAQWQIAAKFNRTLERIKSPRRLLLTLVAGLLTMVWLGQAIAGVMLRQSAPAEKLLQWIPLSLGAYFVWNFIKSVSQKPVEPFEWTAAEREWLFGAPLQRTDIIHYRCSTITRSAFIKSLIFTFVMIPDLTILPLGFLGVLVSLVFIDMCRAITEIVAYGMRPKELLAMRCLIFAGTAIVATRALAITFLTHEFSLNMESAATFGFLLQLLNEFSVQASSWYGELILLPFNQLARVMVAESIHPAIWMILFVGCLSVISMSKLMMTIDQYFLSRRTVFEQEQFSRLRNRKLRTATATPVASQIRPPHLFGCGGLAWRQWLGAKVYRKSLAVSLGIPAFLSCLPAFSGATHFSLVANTAGALAFYSLVLLPASLKFDFRRDVDRLTVLKSLPLSPLRICVGQLAVPIIITTVFQLFSLLLVMLLSPFNPILILGAVAVLLPFNIFIFGFENLAFLWYPHRMNQEGMQVLLRSMLVFTAKSLIFAAAFFATFVWVLTARWINDSLVAEIAFLNTASIFSAGMIFLMFAVSATTFGLLVQAFSKFDPSRDLVGLD